jgi:hypothetical protein
MRHHGESESGADPVTNRLSWARRYPLTALAAVVAVSLVLAALAWDIDLINIPLSASGFAQLQPGEVDEVVISILLLIAAFCLDRTKVRAQDAARLQAERLRVVHVTMRTVLDIANNCLNELQLFRFEARDALSQESLASFDQTVRATAAKLKALGDLESFAEKQLPTGPGLDVGRTGPSSA